MFETFITVNSKSVEFDVHQIKAIWEEILGHTVILKEVVLPVFKSFAYNQVISVNSDRRIGILELGKLLTRLNLGEGRDGFVGLSEAFKVQYPHLFVPGPIKDKPIEMTAGAIPYVVPA